MEGIVLNNMKMDRVKQKKILLDTLKYFISICETNQLTYFIAAGSTLGAVRHHDIIPWDDDIDIYMPREDYEKLLSLEKSINNSEYEIISLKNTGYYLPFAKMVNLNTTIWEYKEFPFVMGIFIDIFPLDRINANKEETIKLITQYKSKFYNYLRGIKKYTFSDFIHSLSQCEIKSFINKILDITYYRFNNNKYLTLFLDFDKQLNDTKRGDYFVVFGGSYGIKEIYKREWFIDYIEIEFAGITVKIPKEYDEYLTYLYGDYMKLPPIEKQISRHCQYYINIECRKTFHEIEICKINNAK